MIRFLLLLLPGVLAQGPQPRLSLSPPNGLRVEFSSVPGLTLIGWHFSVNHPLPGVQAGQINVDITAPDHTGHWVHETHALNIKPGDTVNYWYLVVINGGGTAYTEQSWTVPFATVDPVITSATEVTAAPNTDAPTTWGPVPNVTNENCDSFPCLIFNEDFDVLDFDRWEHEITMGGGGNWEFQMYHNSRRNSYVKNGRLYIRPTLTADDVGEEVVTNGRVDLWGASPADQCTGNGWFGCDRSGGGGNVVNPVQSARLRTVRSFNFRYGRVEVEAKMPTGDWLWPAIWLLPQHNAYGLWPKSGEIDIVESRGNLDLRDPQGNWAGVQSMGMTMHWGQKWNQNAYPKTHQTRTAKGGTFGTDFHRYRLDWGPDIGLQFYLDDEHVMSVNPPDGFWNYGREFWQGRGDEENPWQYAGATRLAPFDQPFYIILNVAVGGTNYFSDNLTNRPYPKPWSNNSPNAMGDFYRAKNQWYPTWRGEDAAMQVNYIRVWKLGPQ